MPAPDSTLLESFHRFVGKRLESASTIPLTPEEAQGLADVEVGRTKPLAEFERDIRQKFGLEG